MSEAELTDVQKAKSDYLYDRRDTEFLLWDHLKIDQTILGKSPYEGIQRHMVQNLFDHAMDIAGALGEHYRSADRHGCRREPDGTVRLAPEFGPLWQMYRQRWFQRNLDNVGIIGAAQSPPIVTTLAQELMMGSNPALTTIGGFTRSAIRLVERSATGSQRELLLPRLRSMEWDACLCITEADAGSDVSAIRTFAAHIEADVYAVCGEKRYITAGAHGFTENTIYIVVARTNQSDADSLAHSCFLVPRLWPDDAGCLVDNFVDCIDVPDKLGFRACPNPTIGFGIRGATRGWLLGNLRSAGLVQLAGMMQSARAATGLYGISLASSAYRHSVEYARRRRQGRAAGKTLDISTPRVQIVRHPDVQRMLLEMKARTEGGRGLLAYLSLQVTRTAVAEHNRRDDEMQRAVRMSKLLTPIVKAGLSESANRVCELAMQIHGGRGYLKDTPVEQYLRDVRILTIWEGTTFIQGQSLVRDVLKWGKDLKAFNELSDEIGRSVAEGLSEAVLPHEHKLLANSFEQIRQTIANLVQHTTVESRNRYSQHFTRLACCLAESLIGWTLLAQSVTASRLLRSQRTDPKAADFFNGKIKAAKYFANNHLSMIAAQLAVTNLPEQSLVCVDAVEL